MRGKAEEAEKSKDGIRQQIVRLPASASILIPTTLKERVADAVRSLTLRSGHATWRSGRERMAKMRIRDQTNVGRQLDVTETSRMNLRRALCTIRTRYLINSVGEWVS